MGLQGPGCSSELGWIAENGPFTVLPNGTLALNEYSWTAAANMLFVDLSLGVGWSHTKGPDGYPATEEDIASDMGAFLEGFLSLFPDFHDRPFVLAGESYAGHYIPHIAKHLVDSPIDGLNFKGIAIGNGWTNPFVQFPSFAAFAYANEMIDDATFAEAKLGYGLCEEALRSGKWDAVDATCYPLTTRLLGSTSPYDIREQCELPPYCHDMDGIVSFFNQKEVKEALHVSQDWTSCSNELHKNLRTDSIKSSGPELSYVIDAGVRVLLYYGDQDFMCNWMGGLEMAKQLEWDHAESFRASPFVEWVVDGHQYGAYKWVDKLSFLRVYNASHMVPMSSPAASLRVFRECIEWQTGHCHPTDGATSNKETAIFM